MLFYTTQATVSYISSMIFQRRLPQGCFQPSLACPAKPSNYLAFSKDMHYNQMKSTDIQSQLKDYKIREGYLLKRSRVLREWRKRWMVLTFNFLFSFENETCSKLTETIDLREVVTLKSGLKNSQEAYPNCIYIQTKSTDFVFSAADAEEKWSWMVTMERLFDFKEKGASIYNNMDMIRSQGFQSQSQYQYKQKIKVKARSARTISVAEEERRRERQTKELLNSLRIKQEENQKKEQAVKRQQNFIQKQKKSSSDCSVQIGQLNSQLRSLQQQNAFLREQVRSLYRKQAQEINSEEDRVKTKVKTIQYLIRWFDGEDSRPELILINEFLLKLNQIQKYEELLKEVAHNCKYLSDFMKPFFSIIQSIPSKNYAEIYRVLTFMNVLFKDQYLLEITYFVEAQKLAVEWSTAYNTDTPLSVLQASISLLQILFIKSYELKQKTLKAVTYLSSLSEDETYQSKCRQTLLKIAEVTQQQ